MTISPERERQLLASVEYPPAALRAIQFLLTRVRELEKREAELTAACEIALDLCPRYFRSDSEPITTLADALKPNCPLPSDG